MNNTASLPLFKRALALWALLTCLATLVLAAPVSVTVGSFNVRYLNKNDGPNNWEYRKDMVVGVIVSHGWEVFGMQEPTVVQLKHLSAALPNFAWVGVGRDDGKEKGEYSPVFYNRERFALVESGHFWLSATPDKPTLGWDALCKRTCVWARLREKASGKEFVFANTHLDHKGNEARKQGAALIVEQLRKIAKAGEPVFLTGDFNTRPGSAPYNTVSAYLVDARSVSQTKPTGSVGTFNGFKWEGPHEGIIDYIFAKKEVKVLSYAVLTDSKDKRWPSDHFPLMAVVELP